MKPIPVNQQQALVERLMKACGGSYTPEQRRKCYISGPQWAAAYEGQALFHAPTREPIGFDYVIRKYGEIGIGYWTTHDTDVIPAAALGTEEQWMILDRIKTALSENGLRCSMVTTETFHHAVWAASPAAETPRGPRVRRVPAQEHRKDRPRARGAIRGLLAGLARLPGAGCDRRDADAALVRGWSERGLRSRH